MASLTPWHLRARVASAMSCPYFRLATVAGHVAPHPVARPAQEEAQGEQQALALCPVAGLPSFTPAAGLYVRELKAARSEILALLDEINCNPILVRGCVQQGEGLLAASLSRCALLQPSLS